VSRRAAGRREVGIAARLCDPPPTEAVGNAQARRSAYGLSVGRRQLLLACCLVVAAVLLRVDGISQPSLSARELHNALLAREYYLGAGNGLPAWKTHVLTELRRSVQPVEPPVLDHVAAWSFRLTGGENLWFPRLISALFWVLGGVFLCLIGLRLTSQEGVLVALALYLFWPYGVVMSRIYMPDPALVSLLLGAALAVIRYWERPGRGRLAAAASAAGIATAVKPGVAFPFLVSLFVALAVCERALRSTLVSGRLLLFAAVAAAPSAAYYVYGTYVRHFLESEGAAGERLQPQLLTHAGFWKGWWARLAEVLVFPQHQRALTLLPLAAALAGLALARKRRARAILAGLGLGYLVYAVAFAAYTASHPYYALPLLPILALAIGTLVGSLLERSGFTQTAVLNATAAILVLVVAAGAYKSRPAAPDRQAIADYRRIGALTRHTTQAVIVDERLRSSAMYWGWVVGHYWYPPTPGQDLPSAGYPFPPWIDPVRAEYLIVVGAGELRGERRLEVFTRNLPVIARNDRFAVFDLRGGRAVDAAEPAVEVEQALRGRIGAARLRPALRDVVRDARRSREFVAERPRFDAPADAAEGGDSERSTRADRWFAARAGKGHQPLVSEEPVTSWSDPSRRDKSLQEG
jgi:4-amino-4-deoxy-L-arabinose transferase-like glycosyltransferase